MDGTTFLHGMLRSATLSSEKSVNSLSNKGKNISIISIAKISPNRRLCYSNEEIVTLCHAIRLQGQRDPIKVFFDGERFKIIDGEKRWRACKRLGVTHLNVVITEIYYTF